MKRQLKHSYYDEAMRYMDNAEEILKKADPKDGFYYDLKYLKSAAGTAYAGVEKAAKWYAKVNGIELKGKNVEMIKDGLRRIDDTVLRHFVSLYAMLLIAKHYECSRFECIKETFENAKEFIRYLKPYSQMAEY